ncbi:Protein of unknown function [Pyronema omphalodes CBS 100304]|uniref:Uncharacterized protein n=1 Tax=Pyronema omphalodes (strain CBS 100304) TaxID=1076935 RepID=U4L3K8_PYROM|nr:Protein of unknown function [Pyronema omphalodes CBS 100304]
MTNSDGTDSPALKNEEISFNVSTQLQNPVCSVDSPSPESQDVETSVSDPSSELQDMGSSVNVFPPALQDEAISVNVSSPHFQDMETSVNSSLELGEPSSSANVSSPALQNEAISYSVFRGVFFPALRDEATSYNVSSPTLQDAASSVDVSSPELQDMDSSVKISDPNIPQTKPIDKPSSELGERRSAYIVSSLQSHDEETSVDNSSPELEDASGGVNAPLELQGMESSINVSDYHIPQTKPIDNPSTKLGDALSGSSVPSLALQDEAVSYIVSSLELQDVETSVNNSSPELEGALSGDLSSEILELASILLELHSSPQLQDEESIVKDSSPESQDVGSSVNDPVSELQDVASSVDNPSSKLQDVASSVNVPSPALQEAASSVISHLDLQDVESSVDDPSPELQDMASNLNVSSGAFVDVQLSGTSEQNPHEAQRNSSSSPPEGPANPDISQPRSVYFSAELQDVEISIDSPSPESQEATRSVNTPSPEFQDMEISLDSSSLAFADVDLSSTYEPTAPKAQSGNPHSPQEGPSDPAVSQWGSVYSRLRPQNIQHSGTSEQNPFKAAIINTYPPPTAEYAPIFGVPSPELSSPPMTLRSERTYDFSPPASLFSIVEEPPVCAHLEIFASDPDFYKYYISHADCSDKCELKGWWPWHCAKEWIKSWFGQWFGVVENGLGSNLVDPRGRRLDGQDLRRTTFKKFNWTEVNGGMMKDIGDD